MAFHHEKLIVYRKSIEFVAAASAVIPTIEPTYGHLRDQLARAATSIAFNVAEGSGEFSKPEKCRFYRMARRSGCECAAILDVLRVIGCPETDTISRGKAVLHEVIAMLTVMSRNGGSEGSGGRSGKA